MEGFERFQRNLSWKVFFSCDRAQYFIKSKCSLNSKIIPPIPPKLVDKQLTLLEAELRKLFSNKSKLRVKSNFSKYQEKLFDRLRGLQNIIFANSDKNLRPVAVLLSKYIEDALLRVKDPSTYRILSNEEVTFEDGNVRKDIFLWTANWKKFIGDDVVDFIRQRLENIEEDPFGYFYLLYNFRKTPAKTHPVCSGCTSILHALEQ